MRRRRHRADPPQQGAAQYDAGRDEAGQAVGTAGMVTESAAEQGSGRPGPAATRGPAGPPRQRAADQRRRSVRRRTVPLLFYVPAGVVYAVIFLVPTVMSFYFALTRWTLFEATFIGPGQLPPVLLRAGAAQRPVAHARLRGRHQRPEGRARACCSRCCSPPASGCAACCARWCSSRCWSAPSRSASPSACCCSPTPAWSTPSWPWFGITGPDWLGDPNTALLSVALVDVWKGVGLATVIYIAGILSIPQDYYEAVDVDGGGAWHQVPERHPPAEPARDVHGHPAVVHRRPALLRPHLDDDRRRPRLQQRRHRLDHLQGVPGRLLRPGHRRQRHPLHPRDRSSSSRCSATSTRRRWTCERRPPARRSRSSRRSSRLVVFVVPFIFMFLTAVEDRGPVRWT